MLTYELKKVPGQPLYAALYAFLLQDIRSGALPAGTKLPSKRTLAENLKVSRITVEAAYNLLLAEGYLRSVEKVGYFVEEQLAPEPAPVAMAEMQEEPARDVLDLTTNGPARFPFSVWSKLQREVMADYGSQLLQRLPHQGYSQLRQAIARHLWDFRGMAVGPENIIIGAGTDFLYNLLIQLLGREKTYAVEDPGYDKIRKIYAAGGVRCISAEMDGQGVRPDRLGTAQVLHISPSHHFPTGIITPINRRAELLLWAEQADGYIIEDDYDSEFRFRSRPMAAMQTMDRQGRVIYMNSFTKSLAPAIRMAYMVLPQALTERFHRELGFYSCTVSGFEQYTLARFLSRGHFEQHINRMRKFYKARRDRMLEALADTPWADRLTVLEEDAGLHFLVKVETQLSDQALTERFACCGIRVHALSSYYRHTVPAEKKHILVINYSGLEEAQLPRLSQVQLDENDGTPSPAEE